jgi:hypothetical protein
LEEYLAVVDVSYLSEDAQEARWNEVQTFRENYIAQCMNDEGFDYIPYPLPWSGGSMSGLSPSVLDDREWVEEFGYGIIHLPPEESSEPPPDPNAAYVSGLAGAERLAYYLTLQGPDGWQPGGGEAPPANPDDYGAGCYGEAIQAWDAEHPERNLSSVEQFQPLFEEIWAFQASHGENGGIVVSPPEGTTVADQASADELARIDAEWASCMAEANSPGLATPQDARAAFYNEYVEPFLAAWDNPNRNPSFDTDPEWAALLEPEIAQALDDLACRESVNYAQRQRDVQWALEAQFVADHQSELDALKAAAEQGGTH